MTKALAVAMLPTALKFLATADTAEMVRDAGDACREMIPNADDRKRVADTLAGLAVELRKP